MAEWATPECCPAGCGASYPSRCHASPDESGLARKDAGEKKAKRCQAGSKYRARPENNPGRDEGVVSKGRYGFLPIK